ncbi:Gti1/Pac2 family-domain-containing protein, partial [Phaeosphaeriaceae sp. PMI808]
MLQGIRASTLTMQSFGHDMSLGGLQKVESYRDIDSWSWPQRSGSHRSLYSNAFDPSIYANFTPQLQPPSRGQPRHHTIATSRVRATRTNILPLARAQVVGSVVKAQPAFKPTWQGFLDTTEDAMTVVEASIQGRLNHISRRPHGKEKVEMLTSGTVLVYEENASGIKRWTDTVHWSPSRALNSFLIYRQLLVPLKPREKKKAHNPSCGTKRKYKESAASAITKSGEDLNNPDDEYENPSFDGSLPGDDDSMNKVYTNFAQSLTPDQQRRYCGSLIDGYEFKEGGFVKKAISVKYQGTHHHVISYYNLEDVVSGKLKRPFQDPKLADIQPRPELLNGWKASLEDEESKDMPLVAGYPHHIQPSHPQHHVIGAVTQAIAGHIMIQPHAQPHLNVPENWHGHQVSQYTPSHHNPQHYASSQSSSPQCSAPQSEHQYHDQQPSPETYASQQPSIQQYVQPPSHQQYSSPQSPGLQFSAAAALPQQYAPQLQPTRHYSYDQPQTTPRPSYPQPVLASQYQP